MKVIIAGGRDFVYSLHHIAWLESVLIANNVKVVISGCAKGADTFGEEVAKAMGLPVLRFHADWSQYYKAAGSIRNEEMALAADICILFPGGSDTDNMRRRARFHDLKLIEYKE